MKFAYLTILLLGGCGSGQRNVQVDSSQDEIPSLIAYSHEFKMPAEDEDWSYYDDHENFISDYFTVKYHDQRIDVTTLIEVNCNDSIIGKINVSNDTIFLISDIFMTDDRLCSEYHTFTFNIRNPENKKYTIISTK
ncbi:MAG: hypothetical protein P8P74_08385 [Crocinitomicaceae bacterium]|nr:hypothetical protein [Crocinitomicaceae bacterium]